MLKLSYFKGPFYLIFVIEVIDVSPHLLGFPCVSNVAHLVLRLAALAVNAHSTCNTRVTLSVLRHTVHVSINVTGNKKEYKIDKTNVEQLLKFTCEQGCVLCNCRIGNENPLFLPRAVCSVTELGWLCSFGVLRQRYRGSLQTLWCYNKLVLSTFHVGVSSCDLKI